MKAIALLTMTFLPGTFVAVSRQCSSQNSHPEANVCGLKSFFAMPLLDWQAPRDGPVVSHRFWIYWAVTLPLTAVVFLRWSTWYLFSGGQHDPEQRTGYSDGRSRREGFDMHVFTAFGLDRMRRQSKPLAGDTATEGLTDDVVA